MQFSRRVPLLLRSPRRNIFIEQNTGPIFVKDMKKKHLHTFSFTNVVEDQDDPSNASTAPHKKDLRISQVVSSLVQRSFQNKNFVRKLPILTWVREYKLSMLVADFIAGLTLGLTTIPQVLGVANVAEMPPEVRHLLHTN